VLFSKFNKVFSNLVLAFTLKLFNKLFPDENNELLENLTLSQYDQIFDVLLENKDLKMIKEIIK
jgi:hypothetical protein